MQRLATYDPYTIEQVQFFVQKKTKYTTVKSILVTLVIFVLTVMLNIGMIEQLWIPRSQLDVVSSERKMSQQPFTSGYVCVIAKTTNTTVPNATLYTFNINTNRTTRTFFQTQIFNSVPQILNVTNGRQFRCFDYEGAIPNDQTYLRMAVVGTNDDFDFMYKSYSMEEIMGSEGSNYFYYENVVGDGQMMAIYVKLKKIRGVIYDSLLVNYEPVEIMGFSLIKFLSPQVSFYTYSYVDFATEFDKPYDTTTEYVIRRANIGQILGKLLSWFSIFVLIAALVVSPILDYNYKVQLCKKLYDNPKLNLIDLSILSYIKYLCSKIKKNLFNQDILLSSFQQLEKDVDLMNLIKKQAMMKKLIKENQFISSGQVDSALNVMVEENTQQAEEIFCGKEFHVDKELLSSQDAAEVHLRSGKSSQTVRAPLVTEPDEQSRPGFICSFFKSLDASETGISLISNKGQGYKTSWNTILAILCVGAVLWFIIFAGLFQMSPNYTISSILIDQDATLFPNITIYPEDMLFRAIKTSPTYNYVLNAVILDGNDVVVENLTLLNGTACDSYRVNLNETTTGWLCLNKSITLYNNGRNNKTKLGLKLTYSGFLTFSVTYIETLFWQYNIIGTTLQKNKMYTKYLYSSTAAYRFDGQAVMYQDRDQELSVPEEINQSALIDSNGLFWTCNKALVTSQALFKGITYEITGEFIKITKQVPTIWDVIDTAWGIVVLSFSVLLSKITRYLNVKQRQKIIKGEQNENRNDIVSIISTQYKLIYQVFYKELQQVRFFYKTRYEQFGAKER